MNNWKALVLTAIIIRLLVSLVQNPFLSIDAYEYYYNSMELEVTQNTRWDYDEWYQRSPAYTFYLYITQQSIYIQILLSVLTVFLLWKLDPLLGWIYVFHPFHVINSIGYHKYTLFIFLLVLGYYYVRGWKYVPLVCLISLGFLSYGGVIDFHTAKDIGLMDSFWEVWKPHQAIGTYWQGWNYILFIPYVFLILMFVRVAEHRSETFIILAFTLVLSFGIPSAQYREPVMWLLILKTIQGYKSEHGI